MEVEAQGCTKVLTARLNNCEYDLCEQIACEMLAALACCKRTRSVGLDPGVPERIADAHPISLPRRQKRRDQLHARRRNARLPEHLSRGCASFLCLRVAGSTGLENVL